MATERVGTLELEPGHELERRSWRAERVGWALLRRRGITVIPKPGAAET